MNHFLTIPILFVSILFSFFSAIHAVLHKRDSRAGFGWVVTCLVFTGFGPVLYWLFGINRIRTHAKKIYHPGHLIGDQKTFEKRSFEIHSRSVNHGFKDLEGILGVSERVNRHPLTSGNGLKILLNGEQAYPEMLLSIRNARKYICLCTYIFDTDGIGREFIQELESAKDRGVKVFVLVDSVGELYSFPWVGYLLKKAGVVFARFMPLSFSINSLHFNLRNHRKILVVDGEMAFMGGMNIRIRHLQRAAKPIQDIHFKVTGPQVDELLKVFTEDWYFSTQQKLRLTSGHGSKPFGKIVCRTICSGPNEDFEKINWMLLACLSSAKRSIRIMTPYFLPDRILISALNAAALRGISIKVILPAENNLPVVAWASRALLWEMLSNGIDFYYQPTPFSHSKLMIVDESYALIGSSNWDARSLRLNFELDLEIYDRAFAQKLAKHFDEVLKRSKVIKMEDLNRDMLPTRFRNALCKLFLPYL